MCFKLRGPGKDDYLSLNSKYALEKDGAKQPYWSRLYNMASFLQTWTFYWLLCSRILVVVSGKRSHLAGALFQACGVYGYGQNRKQEFLTRSFSHRFFLGKDLVSWFLFKLQKMGFKSGVLFMDSRREVQTSFQQRFRSICFINSLGEYLPSMNVLLSFLINKFFFHQNIKQSP